ncbi:hypothetical protein IU500_23275 [Nocardia terpenica]|uniref:hypothetical protein n=1 Tax=Nocardia terpenica TaxID=455432 RepID=UPI001893F0DF|nr:hypothetical protein [Nocardia terpenica]MBF6064411.1 hypothetical protein [Nocardia terpenica]MBF6106965.1 hypothetical protein [Nocardia terpenica]MBF6114379.1 hypothetical protein [Nocardia terpenica]MBF6121535.1 hypothetical protein [Nocardia terpenica]MBF6153950.1 hypothetical protein [Nocardia terpenica]
MAVVDPTSRPAIVPRATIDIAGTPWPVYKLEALALALPILLILALVTGSLQIAVLAATAVGALRWIVGAVRVRLAERTAP